MEYFDIKSGEWVEEECVEENGFVVNTKGELVKYKDFDKIIGFALMLMVIKSVD